MQPADSTAKFWVKKPCRAILRKDKRGVFASVSGKLARVSGSVVALPTNSAIANTKGLESHPPGSAGKLSRPATVKLLAFPPASAAHRWLKSVVAISGFCPRGTIFPLAGEIGD